MKTLGHIFCVAPSNMCAQTLPLASLDLVALPYMGIGSRDMVLKDFTNVSTPLRAACAARAARAARVKSRIKSG